MTILIPQLYGLLSRQNGTDLYGSPVYGTSIRVGLGVVRLQLGARKTSVRADSSATRGGSDETTIDAVLLFEPKVEPQMLDRLVVHGVTLRVVGFQPRFDLLGNLAHWQVDLEIEAG